MTIYDFIKINIESNNRAIGAILI